jgi:hypothetical protein
MLVERFPTSDVDILLRGGLSSFSPRSVRAAFDDEVLAALRLPPTVWEQIWAQARTGAAAALCGACLMLAFIQLGSLSPSALDTDASSFVTTRQIDFSRLPFVLKQPNLTDRLAIAILTAPEPSQVAIQPPPTDTENKTLRRASSNTRINYCA